MSLHPENRERKLLQELVSKTVASAPTTDPENMQRSFSARQKQSSATLLRHKLAQGTLKREFRKI